MTEQKTRKTAAEKAQDDLDRAERKVKRLEERYDNLDRQMDSVIDELKDAKAARDYIAQHPALTQRDPEPKPVAFAVEADEIERAREQAPEPSKKLDEPGIAPGKLPF